MVCAGWTTCETSMHTPTRRLPWPRPLALLLLLAPCGLPAVRGEPPVPLAVRAGSCEAVLDTADPGAQFYLIFGSLAAEPGPFRVTVRTEATGAPVAISAEPPTRSHADAALRQQLAQRLERARQQRPPREQFPPLQAPPQQKVFYLFTGDQDFHDAAAYSAVTGELRALGRHCQVYVDR